VPWDVACDGNWLSAESSALIPGEESAEGIGGPAQAGRRPARMARRDRKRLDRSTAPDQQPVLPCVDRRGEASVRVSAGNAPVADERGMEGVVERKNLFAALARVKTNGGSPGIDGLTVDAWPGYLRRHWPGIRASLVAGTYRPSPGKRVESPKPGGGGTKARDPNGPGSVHPTGTAASLATGMG
jgi:hypothetical protein